MNLPFKSISNTVPLQTMPQKQFVDDLPNYHRVIVIDEAPEDGIVEVIITSSMMPLSVTVRNNCTTFQLRLYKGTVPIIAEILGSGYMVRYDRAYLDSFIRPPPHCFGVAKGATLEIMTSLLVALYRGMSPMQIVMYAQYLTGENQNVLIHLNYIDDRIGERIHRMFGGFLTEM